MKVYPSKLTCCGADKTSETAVQERMAGTWNGVMGEGAIVTVRRVRAKQVFHRRGEERFWHWSDQEVREA